MTQPTLLEDYERHYRAYHTALVEYEKEQKAAMNRWESGAKATAMRERIAELRRKVRKSLSKP